MDLPSKERKCHHTGFTKSCRRLVTSGQCERWMQIQGTNPNTGEPVNRCNCIDDWTPMLLIENSQMQRQTCASIENFRNEVVIGRVARSSLPDGEAPKLINGDG